MALGFTGGGVAAPIDASYIVQTPSATLTGEQALSSLATGILKNTTGTGVLTIANAGTDYYAPGGTDVAVVDGGTGVSSLTAYAVICGGTTATNPVQSIASVGTAGDLLVSNGAGALPTFQTIGYEVTSNKSSDDTFAAADNTTYPTTLAVKTYADGLVVGLLDDRGNYDASVNTFPATGGSGSGGAILKGDIWYISVGGTLGGSAVNVGDSVRALVDTPGQTAGNWDILESNIGYTPENVANKSTNTALGTSDTLYPTQNAVKVYADTKSPAAGSASLTTTGTVTSGIWYSERRMRVQSVASSATVTADWDADDQVNITAQAVGLTLANPSNTATEGQRMVWRIKDDGTARSIAYGAQFRAIGVTLPTTTVISKTIYLGGIWNGADSKVDVVAVAEEA